ncbi:hypothetical protein QQ045_031945 [Rhodiola kirilowii]
MIRALGIKVKLGFVQGLFPRPIDDPYKLGRWERCNSFILPWISNSVSKEIVASLVHSVSSVQAWTELQHIFGGDNSMRIYSISKDINLLMQGEMNVYSYFGKLLQLWGDEDSYEDDVLCELGEKCKSTKCMHDKKQNTRIQKFLMGLNDVHSQIRTQILSTRPKLGLDDAYALVISDESQKNITKRVVVEASALYSSYTNQTDRSYSNQMDMPYSNTNDRQLLHNKAYNTGANPNANRNKRPFCTHAIIWSSKGNMFQVEWLSPRTPTL